ncbi:hypothetical protein [Aquipseudomonas alcaligenes]|uniref:Uncharacterized protein n=1 Tax=Aquipseudomonas alcaligenes TaxID=43263 RepID=A0AA42N107_AQUAC|nr:hypothetical protein [Pseudomonas alcaligenes]MDH1055478.1 hypothetical protein [Pseudomonas alcaligenes]
MKARKPSLNPRLLLATLTTIGLSLPVLAANTPSSKEEVKAVQKTFSTAKASCSIGEVEGLDQQVLIYTSNGKIFAVNQPAKLLWHEGKIAEYAGMYLTPEQMQKLRAFGESKCPSLTKLQKLKIEGQEDGFRYRVDLRKNGIDVNGTACAIGAAAEDRSRPNLSQSEIEAYAENFANGCMGRKIY